MGDHHQMTRMSIDSLPDKQADLWREGAPGLVEEYCKWPDMYFDPALYDRIAPYQLVIDGVAFHYPPISTPTYGFCMEETSEGALPKPIDEGENRNWLFMRQGLAYYCQHIINHLRAAEVDEAAKYLGVLLHVIQDTHEVHSLEGAWGMDFLALDRLLDADGPDRIRSITTEMATHDFDHGNIEGYRPQLLGGGLEETVFRLYGRYCSLCDHNRKLQIPVALKMLDDQIAEADDILRRISRSIAMLCADVMYTLASIAEDRFIKEEHDALCTHPLEIVSAVKRSWNARGKTYRLRPFVDGSCVDQDGKKYPLAIRDSIGNIQTFSHGWGSGIHEYFHIVFDLPEGVYRQFSMTAGLHHLLGEGGPAEIEWQLNGQKQGGQRITAMSPVDIQVPVEQGGELRLSLSPVKGVDASDVNVVWGEPTLMKG